MAVHASMILNMTLSWLSGVSSEAVGYIGNDFELIFHGEVKFSGDLFLSPDLCSPRPGIKLVLSGTRFKSFDAVEVKVHILKSFL